MSKKNFTDIAVKMVPKKNDTVYAIRFNGDIDEVSCIIGDLIEMGYFKKCAVKIEGSVIDNKFEWSYIHLKNHLLTISRGQYLYMDSDCVFKVGFLTDYEPAEQ